MIAEIKEDRARDQDHRVHQKIAKKTELYFDGASRRYVHIQQRRDIRIRNRGRPRESGPLPLVAEN